VIYEKDFQLSYACNFATQKQITTLTTTSLPFQAMMLMQKTSIIVIAYFN